MNDKVQCFYFDNLNAPALSNTWGCLVDVLDACLVNGYGDQPVETLVVQDGVGIATFSGSHLIRQFQWIEISGADEIAINGEFKVIGLTNTTVEFEVDLPDQIIGGTINCKIASLGWEKSFEDTNKRVYRAADLVSNPYYLRVDNSRDTAYTSTYGKFAKVGLLESCEGIDDVSGNQTPYNASDPTKNWVTTGTGTAVVSGWFKWVYAVGNSANTFQSLATATTNGDRQWVIVGNASGFYLVNNLDMIANQGWAKVVQGVGICRKRDIATPFLLAFNHPSGASYGQYYQNPILMSSYANFAFMRNVRGALANTTFSALFGELSTYSGYTGAVTQDVADGDVFVDMLAKDPSGYLAGVIDLAKYVLHNTSADEFIRFAYSDGRSYLQCRTATNTVGGANSMLKTAIAFDLGEI